jgi:H/ACA ribonucleoprotein complex subunit 2
LDRTCISAPLQRKNIPSFTSLDLRLHRPEIMASDKPEKKDKKDKKEKKEKKNKHTEDGVSKPKSDKKEKKSKGKSEGVVQQISTAASALVPSALNGRAEDHDDEDDGDAMEVDAPVRDVPDDALVPFANPLADEKQTKKLLKGVKRGMSA